MPMAMIFGYITRRRQFALQQFRRVRLHEQLRFEIEPGRQPEIGVGRPREAIDAAVLAAAIGIDRAVEGNVRRVVAGDDLAGGIDRHRRLERRQVFESSASRRRRRRAPAARSGRTRCECAPRPRRRSRSTAVPRPIARRRGGQRRRRASQCCDDRVMARKVTRRLEQNKNNYREHAEKFGKRRQAP